MLVWYAMMTLMADALQVVDMRLRQIAPGKGTADEVFLMVAEKIDAAAEARTTIFLRGGDYNQLVDRDSRIYQPTFRGYPAKCTFRGFESLWELSASCGEETRGRASSSQDAHISSVLPLRDTTGDNRRSAGSLLNP